MSITDRIAAVTGLNYLLNRQQAKQGGAIKELEDGGKRAPFLAEEKAVAKDVGQAEELLSRSSDALKSVTANLQKAMEVAGKAFSAAPEERSLLADQFNRLIRQTKDFTDNAGFQGLDLVGSKAKSVVVKTTAEGGQVMLEKAHSSGAALGIDLLGKASWLDRQAIQSSVNELQNALITLSSTQTQFAQAQHTLALAAELNRAGTLTDYRSQAAVATATIARAAHSEWEAEARRTVAEEANREAALREAYGRQMRKE